MPASAHDLIGQILDPRPAPGPSGFPGGPALPSEPASVLIGMILSPSGPRTAWSAAPSRAEAARPEPVIAPPAA